MTEDLGPLSPEKGRLRAFLRAAFNNYIADETRRGLRQKRGGNKVEWLDLESAEQQCQRHLQEGLTPDEAFDRHWARIVLQRSLSALKKKFRARGREKSFKALEIYLGHDDAVPGYREVAERLGQSENAVAAAVKRMRQEFRDLLRQEIAETLGSAEDIDEELRYLLRAAS
jgi:RNA polymerase sigma-70 factor (ECF subfamily)